VKQVNNTKKIGRKVSDLLIDNFCFGFIIRFIRKDKCTEITLTILPGYAKGGHRSWKIQQKKDEVVAG
jgi:hypothetical protein